MQRNFIRRAAISDLVASGLVMVAVASHAATHRNTKAAPKPSHAPLAQQMDTILADPAIAGAGWGISVVAMDGAPIYQHNDGERFAAASNTKLLTTASALALLGPQFSVTTRVVAPSGVASGTVRGDLTLVGAGDTSMSARVLPYSQRTERNGDPLAALDDLAAQVARAGVREVTGNIVGDDTYFAHEPWPTGWEWNDLQWEYGAPVSALVTNDNVMYLSISPGAAPGDPAIYQWLPQLEHFTIESSIRTVASGAGVKTQLGASRDPNSNTVRLWGTIPVNAQPASMALAADDAAVLAAEALKERLLAHGVRVDGHAVARHRDIHAVELPDEATGGAEPSAMGLENSAANQTSAVSAAMEGTTLATRRSPPLLQDLIVTNKVSQNLHAEVALLQLNTVAGDVSADAPNPEASSRRRALAIERRFLLRAGLAPADFLLKDGSGLSRDDMVTPRALTTLLRFAAGQPWGAEYKSTLPVGGVDGTLSGRFAVPPLKGQVFAKTGSLGEDASLSGYVTAASGRTVIFSILCNRHLPGTAAKSDIDRMVAAIAAVD
jgi:D-alanyl-D-alanine carboxypeptidase/D-alanyl-D-alanine-endopeptidase (penicillin-binding protein 4)